MEGLVSTMLQEEKKVSKKKNNISRSLTVNVNADAMKQECSQDGDMTKADVCGQILSVTFGLWLALLRTGSKWGTVFDYISIFTSWKILVRECDWHKFFIIYDEIIFR